MILLFLPIQFLFPAFFMPASCNVVPMKSNLKCVLHVVQAVVVVQPCTSTRFGMDTYKIYIYNGILKFQFATVLNRER